MRASCALLETSLRHREHPFLQQEVVQKVSKGAHDARIQAAEAEPLLKIS